MIKYIIPFVFLVGCNESAAIQCDKKIYQELWLTCIKESNQNKKGGWSNTEREISDSCLENAKKIACN